MEQSWVFLEVLQVMVKYESLLIYDPLETFFDFFKLVSALFSHLSASRPLLCLLKIFLQHLFYNSAFFAAAVSQNAYLLKQKQFV